MTARIPGDGYTGGRPAPEEPTALSDSDLDTTGPRLTVSDTDMDELTSDGPMTAALPPDPAEVTDADRRNTESTVTRCQDCHHGRSAHVEPGGCTSGACECLEFLPSQAMELWEMAQQMKTDPEFDPGWPFADLIRERGWDR